MNRLALAMFVGIVALSILGASAQPPSKPEVPVGKWKIEFANLVVEECRIGAGREATVKEPRRQAKGVAKRTGDSIVITFADDRVERWTRVGKRFVVEHWAQGSRLPIEAPVLGIAQRIP